MSTKARISGEEALMIDSRKFASKHLLIGASVLALGLTSQAAQAQAASTDAA